MSCLLAPDIRPSLVFPQPISLFDGSAVERDRFFVGIGRAGALAGAPEVAERLLRVLRSLEVVGQSGYQLLQPLGEERLDRLARAAVQLLPPGDEQTLISHLLGHDVLE